MTLEGRCKKCFALLKPDAKFCQRCGEPVPQGVMVGAPRQNICPACKHPNTATAAFCESCGTELARPGTAAPAAYRAPEPADAAAPSQSEGPQEAGLPRYPSESEDPWNTGADPRYRPVMQDALCPRCGTFKPANAVQCSNCGLPFTQVNYDGIPYPVIEQGAPAGFWIRFAAALIDGIITFLITFVIILVWVLSGDNLPAEGEELVLPAWSDWLSSIISFAYSVFFLANWGATPGKRLLNIYVLDSEGRQRIGYGRAIVRTLATILSAVILLIGYIMVAFRQDKRALHDLIAGTYPTVIRKRW